MPKLAVLTGVIAEIGERATLLRRRDLPRVVSRSGPIQPAQFNPPYLTRQTVLTSVATISRLAASLFEVSLAATNRQAATVLFSVPNVSVGRRKRRYGGLEKRASSDVARRFD